MKLSAVSGLVRGSNWWYSKIPPLLAVAYAEIALQRLAPGVALSGVAALLVSACCVAAYGHVLNDICDIEADRRAGKTNAMARLTRTQRAALCLALAAAGLAPWLVTGLDRASALLLACLYALPVIYNVPPVRLKEHGVWGVLADAAQAHAVPTLFTVTLFSHLALAPARYTAAFGSLAVAWATCRGLRDIMRHQLWDRENDVRSEVTTYATRAGPERIRLLVNRAIFPGEVLTLGGIGIIIYSVAPWLVLCLLALGALFLIARLAGVWNVSFDPAAPALPASMPGADAHHAHAYVPLVEFYTVWPVLGLALHLSCVDRWFIPLVVLHVALFWDALRKQVADLGSLLYGLLKTARRIYWAQYAEASKLYRKVRRRNTK